MAMLDLLKALVQTVEAETCASFESIARERIDKRDEDEWPVLAAALALECPIWTEDTDFLGCGVRRGRPIEWNCTWRRPRSRVGSSFPGEPNYAASVRSADHWQIYVADNPARN